MDDESRMHLTSLLYTNIYVCVCACDVQIYCAWSKHTLACTCVHVMYVRAKSNRFARNNYCVRMRMYMDTHWRTHTISGESAIICGIFSSKWRINRATEIRLPLPSPHLHPTNVWMSLLYWDVGVRMKTYPRASSLRTKCYKPQNSFAYIVRHKHQRVHIRQRLPSPPPCLWPPQAYICICLFGWVFVCVFLLVHVTRECMRMLFRVPERESCTNTHTHACTYARAPASRSYFNGILILWRTY